MSLSAACCRTMRKYPPMFILFRLWLAAAALLLAAGPAAAVDPGQEDLDKAIDAKLSADTITDLGEVIRLGESALQKGLDADNAAFAKKLVASTLMQRARETVKLLLAQLRAGAQSPDVFHHHRQFALADLKRVVELDPKQPEAFLLIAQLNGLPGGNAEAARESVDKAIALGLADPAAQAKALQLRAGLQTEPQKQLDDLDEALRLMPDNLTSLRARGLLLGDLGNLDAALVDLNKAIELSPKDGPLLEAKAVVLARLNRYDEALAVLDAARKLAPNSIMPLVQRARIHSQQTDLDAAVDDLTQALTLDSNNAAVLLMRASVYQAKNQRDKALADVDQALKVRPDLPLAIRTRAVLLAESERIDEAVGELEKLRKLDPKDTLTLLQLATLYGHQKQSEKAIDAFTALLAAAPDDWRALAGRGDMYLNLGRQAEAIADYERSLKSQPRNHHVLNNLAWVLATSPDEKLRDGRRAIQLAAQACEITEYKLAYILSTLAAAHALTGDFDAAIKWSSKAVEIAQKDQDDQLRRELESYRAKKPWRELAPEDKPAKKTDAAREKQEPASKNPLP